MHLDREWKTTFSDDVEPKVGPTMRAICKVAITVPTRMAGLKFVRMFDVSLSAQFHPTIQASL
jgi:hypothetical protein